MSHLTDFFTVLKSLFKVSTSLHMLYVVGVSVRTHGFKTAQQGFKHTLSTVPRSGWYLRWAYLLIWDKLRGISRDGTGNLAHLTSSPLFYTHTDTHVLDDWRVRCCQRGWQCRIGWGIFLGGVRGWWGLLPWWHEWIYQYGVVFREQCASCPYWWWKEERKKAVILDRVAWKVATLSINKS